MLWSPLLFANRRWSSQYNPTSDVTKKKKKQKETKRKVYYNRARNNYIASDFALFFFPPRIDTAPFSLVIFLSSLMINSDPPLKCRSGIILGGERSGSRRIDRITARPNEKRHGPSQEGNKRAKGGGITVCVYTTKEEHYHLSSKRESKERKISFPSHPILLFRFFFFFSVWELDL